MYMYVHLRKHTSITYNQRHVQFRIAARHDVITDLSDLWLVIGDADDENGVGLTYAALRPRRHAAVALVEHHAVDVLLLTEPAREAVLVDAVERRAAETVEDDLARQPQRHADRRQAVLQLEREVRQRHVV